MLIDVRDAEIRIYYTSTELKPRHRSQLSDWSFARSEEGVLKRSDADIRSMILKILEYFKESNLHYTLSESCDRLVAQVKEEAQEFDEMATRARRFKDGHYDTAEFAEHLDFLRSSIHRQLKDHQVKAFLHLALVNNGANFSVPGSGKTSVVLAHYEHLRSKGEVNVLFVVGPAACFAPWRQEYKAVLGKQPNYVILAGGDRIQRRSEYYKTDEFPDLYLTTFQTLLNDQDEVCVLFRDKAVNAYLVVDEAHYVKQIDGQWANAVLTASRHAKYRCVLTGTPIPRSYTDLFNLFEILWPSHNPISREDQVHLAVLEERNEVQAAQQILERTMGPLFYRVRKSELALKEQVFNEPVVIPMNPCERRVYDAINNKIRDYAQDDYLRNIDLVLRLRRGRMIRLRQCLSYTKLLSTAVDDYNEDLFTGENDLKELIVNYDQMEHPAKLDYLLTLVRRFHDEGEKMIIWAHFIGTVKLIQRTITDAGYYCKKIIGEVPTEKANASDEETREQIISEFVNRSSGLDILIANPAACAESISLHKTCHNAVYYDLSYNGAQYLQSLDRIHRVGGSEDKEAYYHYIQYEDTIDADILANLREKAEKMYAIIDGDYSIYSLDMFENAEEGDLAAYERLFCE